MDATKSDLLKPLLFSAQKEKQKLSSSPVNERAVCPLCDDLFPMNEAMLHHLLTAHKLVIADVKLVADFKRYLEYWRERFRQKPLDEFCSVIKTNSRDADQAPSETYFLLCDVLPEDKTLREKLQKERLDLILEQQQLERNDANFSRKCLFCDKHFAASRASLFNHMSQDHNFSMGQPDNIVFGNELLDLLEEKLKNLQCLYCEKTFRDWQILKEHMRKKQHRMINPKNVNYDKFYVINYLEMGKNWESLQAEEDADDTPWQREHDDNVDWDDWTEEAGAVVCLFCDWSSPDSQVLLSHMKEIHSFDLDVIKINLNFYHQVKLVNYIRRQVYQRRCVYCEVKCESRESLLAHLSESGHAASVPDSSVWDQPQYFFPTYEDDQLLCILDEDRVEETVRSVVVPEDAPRGDPETLQRILSSGLASL